MRTPKILAAALLIVLILLQVRIWLSHDGIRAVERLDRAVSAQQTLNARLTRRNERLAAEVADLKTGTAALEELARSQLGMIGPDETFYQVVEPAPNESSGAITRRDPCASACGPPAAFSVAPGGASHDGAKHRPRMGEAQEGPSNAAPAGKAHSAK